MPVDGPSYLVGRTDARVLTIICQGTNYRCLWTLLYDIYTTSTKRLGVVITQDNWPIVIVVNGLQCTINKHHYRIKTLSQMSSAECCGDINIRLYQPYLKRDGRTDTQQRLPLDNTLKGICPRDNLYVRIHNTVADATKINNPKLDSTIEYAHACMRSP